MFAGTSKKVSHGGSPHMSHRDGSQSRSKVKKRDALPPPFAETSLSACFDSKDLFSPTSLLKNIPSDKPMSLLELPHIIGQVGSKKAIAEAKWTDGPRLMASFLEADIPIKAHQLKAESHEVDMTTCKGKRKMKYKKATKLKYALTGTEVVQMFAEYKKIKELFFLKEVDENAFRPYDLQVVRAEDAGPEHYIFSSDFVLHVTRTGFGGTITLAEWHREYVLWTALQDIHFFRHFRVRKAFSSWHKKVRIISFRRKCNHLQDQLLLAVPQFRTAVHLLFGVLEELQGISRMNLDDFKNISLQEFNEILETKRKELFLSLQKLSKYHVGLLNVVKDGSYTYHRELLMQLELAKKLNRSSEPIHLLLDRQRNLKKQLTQSEGILKKLGNFAALTHQMILQSLVTVVHQDARSFLDCFKRVSSQQCSFFYTKLCFTADGQLTIDPPICEFQKTLTEFFLGAGNNVVQMCDRLGFFLDIRKEVINSDPDLTSELSCIKWSTVTGANTVQMNKILIGNQLLHSEPPFLMVQSERIKGCYYPLSKTKLEWYINTIDVTKQVQTEQAKIIQVTELEIEQVCKTYTWLKDIHLFASQWSPASLESLKEQPASVYEEHIKKLHQWAQRIHTVCPSTCISSNLIVIDSTHLKENLLQQLSLIKDQLQEQLVDQMKRESESLISLLERMTAELKTEPEDVHDFSKYALMVREFMKTLADMQSRLEYILSLRNAICMCYRKISEPELTLEEKMLGLWDNFNHLLKQAHTLVSQRLPSMCNALETKFSCLITELQNIVSKATSGPFVDPSQNANEMVSKLKCMCDHVQSLSAELEEVNGSSQRMQDQQLDITTQEADVQKVITRKELWQLRADFTSWREKWSQQPLVEVGLSEAQEKIAFWKNQTESLKSLLPAGDAVLDETSRVLERLSLQIEVLEELKKPTIQEKHWGIIFQGMGLLENPEKNLTVGHFLSALMSETDQILIQKVCREAKTEWDLEERFQKLCLQWKERLFQLHGFIVPVCSHCKAQFGLNKKEIQTESTDSRVQSTCPYSCMDPTFTIVGIETLIAEAQRDLITLSYMLKSPQSVKFRLQLEDFVQSLNVLAKLLDLLERYQQMWAFLTKTFRKTSNYDELVNLLNNFQQIDDVFQRVIQLISKDLHVWSFVLSEMKHKHDGESIRKNLMDGLLLMEDISNHMDKLFECFCEQFPRLYFMSDREIIKLLSFHPLVSKQQFFLRKLFHGVHLLEVEHTSRSDTRHLENLRSSSKNPEQMKVLGFFGSLQEYISFQPPVGPNPDTLAWLCSFEYHLKLSVQKLIKQCAALRSQLEPVSQDSTYNSAVGGPQLCDATKIEDVHPLLDLLVDFPLQCLLVVEEAFWCQSVLKTLEKGSPLKLSNVKTHNLSKLNILGNVIRNKVLGSVEKPLISKYGMVCLRALIQLAMKHEQLLSRLVDQPGALESSFEWLSMLKYHINSEEGILECSDNPSCYVDILDHHFQYGFEYYGPDEWLMVNTPSTERATLGIVLALTRYRPGFVNGPSMSGRTNTVIQLGQALGQPVVVKQCFPSMGSSVVQRMLRGAIQGGVWLLLECVDLLSQNVLYVLGHLLTDIHLYYFNLQKQKIKKLCKMEECKTTAGFSGCINASDPESPFKLLGKTIFPNPSYGCFLSSSSWCSSNIPESLRFTSRPVSLAHPDYRIVAEVTLASTGFLEAAYLGHRLVCLLSLIKDSGSLPAFFNDSQSCFLVVLKKIISASEIYLQHAVSQREISIQAQVIAAEQSDPLSVESLPDKHLDKEKQETNFPKLQNPQLFIIQSLIEETAVVKAILSVLIPEHKKAPQFYTILKDTFPIVSQFPDFRKYIQEREKDQLQHAVVEELLEVSLYCDTEVINQALTLYEALQFSQTVVLIGPSGSGKTFCYNILAGALNRLAGINMQGSNNINNRDSANVDSHIPPLNWCYIDTLVFFPNAMSHNELFGYSCEKRGWKDGAVAKVLKDSERRCFDTYKNEKDSKEIQLVKWLVMDGEPVGRPSWLDYLTTLGDSQDPHLCLSSGETVLVLSQLNLLFEITDLKDASPSAVTRCGLVYFTQPDLWKAIWKTEMEALSNEHKLSQEVQKMWNRLADDLFSSTLSLFGQHALSSANHFEKSSCENHGLQEITSFTRILRALLQHFVKELNKINTKLQKGKTGETVNQSTEAQGDNELLARNIFLVAYVWGFGGHLHSRYWPQFNVLARQVLVGSRYKIQVPNEHSLFEHFIANNGKMCSSSDFITPKLGTYRHLLNLMLKANQPVFLAGEPGSGRTTLSNSLSFDQPSVKLTAGPLLSRRDLHIIMKNIGSQKNSKDNKCSVQKLQSLLLLVDDLHEAPCDVFGKTSTVLETLRQSMSKGEILTFDSYSFESLSSGAVNYLTTADISRLGDPGSHGISLRLSRLFSIFVLPSLSEDTIFSFYSPRLKIWLGKIPLTCSAEEMSNCIITATKNLYDAVCEKFQPSAERPFFLFSHHDIQKVFSGMYLWKHNILSTETHEDKNLLPSSYSSPSTASAAVLNIIHLWMHECMRTFSDRLCSEDEMNVFLSLVGKTAATHYGCHFIEKTHVNTLKVEDDQPVEPKCTSHSKDHNYDAKSRHQGMIPAEWSDSQKVQAEILSRDFSREEANPESRTVRLDRQIETDIPRLVFAPEFFEASKYVRQPENIKDICLYQQQEIDVLQQKLHEFLDRKVSGVFNISSRYIVHRQGMSQLLHIFRALLLPGGHGVLIRSGRRTGRKTAVRLAAHIAGYQLLELHSDNESEFHEILKEDRTKTNVDRVNVVILVHENISPSVREELLMVMAQKAFPLLYREESLGNHVFKVTSLKHQRKYLQESWINEKSLGEEYKNVHVFLLMPFAQIVQSDITANKETHDWSVQLSKALKLSCCVEVYQPWSSQSLAEVAVKCLRMCPNKTTKDCSVRSLSVAIRGIHQSACRHASVFLGYEPFGPSTYLEFITCFGSLCSKLYNQWKNKHSRITTALTHLDAVRTASERCKKRLVQLQEQVDKSQQMMEEIMGIMEEKKGQLDIAVKKLAVGERKMNHLADQIVQSQNMIKSVFLSGLKIAKCLNQSDLEEVRHYRDPPDVVVKVMNAVCLMFNRPAGWESAKQLLGQPDFFQELEFFDRSSLTNEQVQQLGQIVQSPEFLPESVREASEACESLCRWVQAVYEYCHVERNKSDKQQLEDEAEKARHQQLLLARQKKKAIQRLEDTELRLRKIRNELELLMPQLYKAQDQEDEATACAMQVEMHIQTWKTAFQETELCGQNIPGDALILAATISYLGPFGAALRSELLSKWQELCRTGSIDINPKDLRSLLFIDVGRESISPSPGFPITVSERLQLPLAWILGINEWQLEDSLSTRLLVKLLLWGHKEACVNRWALLADVEQHSEMSCTTGTKAKFEEEIGFEMVLSADDLQLLDKLDLAAVKGWKVLVTHAERAKSSLEFLAKLVHPRQQCFHGPQQPLQPVHPDFCLFLSTPLPVRLLSSEIDPSILAQVLVVDLSLSSEEIQELMLTQLLQSECRELLIRHTRSQNYNQSLQAKLASAEEELMDYILRTDSLLFKDSDSLPRLAACQLEMKKILAEKEQLREELDYHESLLASPRQLMKFAVALYQALQAVSQLSPAYFFSLQNFMQVIQAPFSVKGRCLVSYTTGEAPESILPEMINTMVHQLLIQYTPCLFKRHVAVLKLLVSLTVLEFNQLCSEAEKLVFLRGLKGIEQNAAEIATSVIVCETARSSADLPNWIPPNVHSELLLLERIPCFNGLIDSLSASPTQWQEYLYLTSSTIVGNVPCCSYSHLSMLQRAILWKTMRPECLEELEDFINTCSLCFTAKTTVNPDVLSNCLARIDGPIILTVPTSDRDMQPRIDPLRFIYELAQKDGMNKVQVKVISLGDHCDKELVFSKLDKAINEGQWLVLNNCHLLDNWDDEVVLCLSQLTTSLKTNKGLIHPCFRLWLVNRENAAKSIPAVVRMCALPLCCDSPWDLKEEIHCSFQQVFSVSQAQSCPDLSEDNKEVLLRCAIFHSVLVQRQTYKGLSFGTLYHWTQEDLLTLLDAYFSIASQCHDKSKALHYIAASIVHGGHISDSADSEVVESVAKCCFATESALSDSGPFISSDLISICGSYDLSALMQVVEQHFRDLSVSNPVMLGFGADVASEVAKINSNNLNLLLQGSQTPLITAGSISPKHEPPVTLPAYNKARERLQDLKIYLTHKEDGKIRDMGASSCSPLRDFLQAEWDDLTDLVALLLSHLLQPIQYKSSSPSLLWLTDLSRLEKRAELLSAYLGHCTASDPAGAYRLAAFKRPRHFLLALMQEAARKNYKYISDIILQFQVLSESTSLALPPPDALCLCGLQLIGASWDSERGALQEADSPEPFSMPVVCVKAQVRTTNDAPRDSICENSYLTDIVNLRAAETDPHLPVYNCPLYLNEECESETLELSDVNIITKVPLHAILSTALCSLRRVTWTGIIMKLLRSLATILSCCISTMGGHLGVTQKMNLQF
ncbi:dynein heavy chain domain-containing protein 1 [Cyprinodon tularosa]|uniref:dynein heavy chain domain-containing protein 1 n=1 Tax=Cyprinodon tularosa TaxID=77115 RepID=UPI0018E2882E|nr:dynein heavy chain domain-containing protein 1 [Cyprinodon tularosa]